MPSLKAGIVGVNGYVGSELARLLLRHPRIELSMVSSRRYAGERLDTVIPGLLGFTDLTVRHPEMSEMGGLDVVFLATPHGVSAGLVPELELAGAGVIVDMSADHRHAPGWVYAQPEWNGPQISCSSRLAIPGCFATAIGLAIAPLANMGAVSGPVCVSGVTGSTGSGAEAKKAAHHPERVVNYKAYKVLGHQHVPEVTQFLDQWGPSPAIQFVPHSGPFDRGIFVTCFIPFSGELDAEAIFRAAYGSCELIRMRSNSPELRWVRGTGFCDVSVHQTDTHVVVLSAIDNLGRGAAFQGIQALNVAMGWHSTLGIWAPALTP